MNHKFYLETILKHLDEGVIIIDLNANIIYLNESVTDIVGVEPKEAISKNLLDVFPGLSETTSRFYQVLKSGEPLTDEIQTYTNIKGKEVTIVTSVIPLKENGKLIGALEIFRDFTQVEALSRKVLELQDQTSNSKLRQTKKTNGTIYSMDDIISRSYEMNKIIETAKTVAHSRSPILIYGETGTGKEILVQAIHNADYVRRKNPFIAQNCAALPKGLLESILFGSSAGSFTGAQERKGLFELAHTGTLFLDEINSMDIELQGKLLRVLEDGIIRRVGGSETYQVDVRIIASSNENPKEAVRSKVLREDLYYRLNVIPITLPPLRRRKEDIPLLVKHFINQYNRRLGKNVMDLDKEVLDLLIGHRWEGNIRELKYMIERTMNMISDKDRIGLEDIPDDLIKNFISDKQEIEEKESLMDSGDRRFNKKINQIESLPRAIKAFEIDLIKQAIDNAHGNCSEAARILGIPKQTLYNKIKKYEIIWGVKAKSLYDC